MELLILITPIAFNNYYDILISMSTQAQTMTISAQIPLSLGKRLSALAAAENRSKSYYIKESLSQFITNKMEDVSDYLEGEKLYREFLASGDVGVTLDDMAKKYKL